MMRVLGSMAIVLACLCGPSLLCAQEIEGVGVVGRGVPVPAKPVVVPKGRITGHIYCADTHKPARGATLLLVPVSSTAGGQVGGMNGFARAGMNGSFDFERVAPGEYAVIGLLPGYLSPMTEMAEEGQQTRGNPPQDAEARQQWMKEQPQRMQERQKRMQEMLRKLGTVTVRGEETETIDTNLERGAAVSGRVLYSDGSPASQVIIDVEDVSRKGVGREQQMNGDNPQAMLSIFTHQSMGTDDQGRFRLSGLQPGRYRIAAAQSPEGDLMDGEEAGMGMMFGFTGPGALRVYSDGTLHTKDAKVYELKAGEETSGVDFTISPEAFHQVRGIVSAKDGRPVMMGKVELTDAADDTLTFSSSIHSNGEFVFPTVPAGIYNLKATGAKIGVPIPGQYGGDGRLTEYNSRITDAFADGSVSVIVKESDVPDVQLALTAVPLPPQPKVPPGMAPFPNGPPN